VSAQASPKISPTGGTESELIERARAGDREAFATLYNEHHETVFRYVFYRTRDRHLAEDITSEAFMRALSHIESFAPRAGSFPAWVVRIARNLHLDLVKSARSRREVLVDEMSDADQTDHSAEILALRGLDIVEAQDSVDTAMSHLNPHQRECVRLRFLVGLSISETAEQMGKGHGAVKTLTYRAMQTMQATLRAEGAAA